MKSKAGYRSYKPTVTDTTLLDVILTVSPDKQHGFRTDLLPEHTLKLEIESLVALSGL